jgi:hypothetical protein
MTQKINFEKKMFVWCISFKISKNTIFSFLGCIGVNNTLAHIDQNENQHPPSHHLRYMVCGKEFFFLIQNLD